MFLRWIRELAHRGEEASVPDFDEHADMAIRLVGEDLAWGRRKQLVAEVEDYLKEQA